MLHNRKNQAKGEAMTDADRDKMEGKVDQTKGDLKEGLGDLRNDEDQQAEGKADQGKGEAKEKLGDAKKKVSEGIDKLTGNG